MPLYPCAVLFGSGLKIQELTLVAGGDATADDAQARTFLGPLPVMTELELEENVAAFSHDVEQRVSSLSDVPRIYQVDDFLSPEECDFMQQLGEPHLQTSLTIDRSTGEYRPDTVRTNQQMYISKEDSRNHPTISNIVRRLHKLARVPIGHGEQIQIGRYTVGQKYDCHYDSEVSVNIVRPATIIVYLNDVAAGGDTVFPMGENCQPLSLCCTGNATLPLRRFHPKRGRAVLFYTHDLSGSVDPSALHGACPVEDGVKWIIQAWFRASLYPDSPHYVFTEKNAEDASSRKELEL